MKSGIHYRCRKRSCKVRIKINNNKCTFQKVTVHNHTDDAQEALIEMQTLKMLNEHLKNKSDEIKNSKKTLHVLVNEFQAGIPNGFKLNIKKNKRKIYRMIRKIKTTTQKCKTTKKIHQSKAKKPKFDQSNLSLNALGKKILAIDEKYEHLIKSNKQPEKLPEPNFDEMDSKTICKICFENECDTIFIPCGHSICERCLQNIRETERKKLEKKYKSKRLITEKMKHIKCHKCRQTIKETHKIFF